MTEKSFERKETFILSSISAPAAPPINAGSAYGITSEKAMFPEQIFKNAEESDIKKLDISVIAKTSFLPKRSLKYGIWESEYTVIIPPPVPKSPFMMPARNPPDIIKINDKMFLFKAVFIFSPDVSYNLN